MLKRWQAMKILLRSTLFKRLTVCIMITGIVAEGLQDLLIQYLQLKLAFGPKDQVCWIDVLPENIHVVPMSVPRI